MKKQIPDFATSSLVLALLSFVFGIISSLPALVLGVVSLEVGQKNWKSISGLILGAVITLIQIIYFIFILSF